MALIFLGLHGDRNGFLNNSFSRDNYFLKSFSSRLAEYSNPEIEVNSKNIINANYTIVSSTLVATNSRPEVKIEWRVYTKDPNNLLIRDLIIEGLSLARTQKEEFSSIINSNDGEIEALFAKYDVDGDRVLDEEEQSKMQADLAKQKVSDVHKLFGIQISVDI